MKFNNGIESWIKEKCSRIGMTSFAKLYSEFCKEHFFVSKTEFGTELTKQFEKKIINGHVFYRGISIKNDRDKHNFTTFQIWLFSRCIDDLSAKTSLSNLYNDFNHLTINHLTINRQAFSRYLSMRYERDTGGLFCGLRLKYPVSEFDI